VDTKNHHPPTQYLSTNMTPIDKLFKSNLYVKALVAGSFTALLSTVVLSSVAKISLDKAAGMTTGVGAGVTAALIVGFKKEEEKS
jgi:hypothetical protein